MCKAYDRIITLYCDYVSTFLSPLLQHDSQKTGTGFYSSLKHGRIVKGLGARLLEPN